MSSSVVQAWRESGGTPAAEIAGASYREMGLGVAMRKDLATVRAPAPRSPGRTTSAKRRTC